MREVAMLLGSIFIFGVLTFLIFSNNLGDLRDHPALRRVGVITLVFFLLLLFALIFDQPKSNTEGEIRSSVASEMHVSIETVSVRNSIATACLRYSCQSWKAELYIYETKVGMAEYGNDNNFIITYLDPRPVPVVILPTPTTAFPTDNYNPYGEGAENYIERPLETLQP